MRSSTGADAQTTARRCFWFDALPVLENSQTLRPVFRANVHQIREREKKSHGTAIDFVQRTVNMKHTEASSV